MITKEEFLKVAKWVTENCCQDLTIDGLWVDDNDEGFFEYSDDEFFQKFQKETNNTP